MKKPKRKPLLQQVLDAVPKSWLDPLLSGPDAIIKYPPYDCRHIQELLLAVAARQREIIRKAQR